VIFHLTPEHERKIKALADASGVTINEQFSDMMTVGSWHDIDKKIKFWEVLTENTRKAATQ